jgi:hypothetical protein
VWKKMPNARSTIVAAYSKWTALCALRSGSRIKSRSDVYSLLDLVPLGQIFESTRGAIGSREFDMWHEQACMFLTGHETRLVVGWAAKLLNVYLKTRGYVAGEGRPGLAAVLHPPIDSGLWLGLRQHFNSRQDIMQLTHTVERIKNITSYLTYARIIAGCRLAAQALDCKLIEVDQLWRGTEYHKKA